MKRRKWTFGLMITGALLLQRCCSRRSSEWLRAVGPTAGLGTLVIGAYWWWESGQILDLDDWETFARVRDQIPSMDLLLALRHLGNCKVVVRAGGGLRIERIKGPQLWRYGLLDKILAGNRDIYYYMLKEALEPYFAFEDVADMGRSLGELEHARALREEWGAAIRELSKYPCCFTDSAVYSTSGPDFLSLSELGRCREEIGSGDT